MPTVLKTVYFLPSIRLLSHPLSLPSARYVGLYTHPPCGIITLSLSHNDLRGCFPGRVTLGEFFLGKAEIASLFSVRMRVRLEIDLASVPMELGVDLMRKI